MQNIPYGRQDISQADIDAVVEVLRETGRLGFLRGLVVQAPTDASETLVASFSATIRKPSKGAPAEPS